MEKLIKYPIGIQTFSNIREGGYEYVDKTAFVRRLVNNGKYYFLTRPRRFGKSLLLSTLRSYFEGERDLFQGLAIAEHEEKWRRHPVLHFDFCGLFDTTREKLMDRLNWYFHHWEECYGKRQKEVTITERLSGIIKHSYEQTGAPVVILIDEYDKPLLEIMDKSSLCEECCTTLQEMYACLQSCDEYIRFVFITGIVRFDRWNMFTGLDRLQDISMAPEYAELCGFTEEELHTCFAPGIEQLAQCNRISVEEAKARLKRRYDGYLFEEHGRRVYNSFGMLSVLSHKDLRDVWNTTGNPDFLVKMVQRENLDLERLPVTPFAASHFTTLDTLESNPLPIMYQSGYLTIDRRDDNGDYYLRFPNEEVESGFLRDLLPCYTENIRDYEVDMHVSECIHAARDGNPERFMKELCVLLKDTSYGRETSHEIFFRNLLFILFRSIGFYCDVDYRSETDGHFTVVIKTDQVVYVLALVVDKSKKVALRQIEEKRSAAPSATDKRKLYKLGVNFNSQTKQIDAWQVVEV